MNPANKARAIGLMDLALLAMVVSWGANFSVVKSTLSQISPLAFNALRMSLASAVIVALTKITERDLSLARRDLGLVLVLGLIGNVAYEILFISGIARTRAGNASLMLATAPIFVALIASITGYEKLSWRNWLGIWLAFLGIYILVRDPDSAHSANSQALKGSLLVLGSTVMWATYTTLVRRLLQRTSALKATSWVMATSTPWLVVVALPELAALDWGAVSLLSWLGLLYSGAVSIAIGYMIWNTGVQRLGPARTSVYSFLTPVVSVIVAWVALGETLRSSQALGGVVVLLGVALARSRPQV